ncbi:hypothetical protein NMS_0085 [Nonlabens marinus S1-08]|uniref:Uncharacterized protein n=1 Tax=Nonlabens marinus S1-08 TaxID=1454201 RepID=W8VMW6_9FLAO|nr:hypothetical protein NMS_0085 [Nonlabens marinus S1-08]
MVEVHPNAGAIELTGCFALEMDFFNLVAFAKANFKLV